jgi:hypothetical protein
LIFRLGTAVVVAIIFLTLYFQSRDKNSTEVKIARINKKTELGLAGIRLAEAKEKTKQAMVLAGLPLIEA